MILFSGFKSPSSRLKGAQLAMEKWQKEYKHVLSDFNEFDIHSNTVLSGCVGSIAHGTYVPKEDRDSIRDFPK